MSGYRYYLSEDDGPEREVTKAEFVRAEMRAGFCGHRYNGIDWEPATSGFSRTDAAGKISGRVEWHSGGEERL